jgi:hypothetical protein
MCYTADARVAVFPVTRWSRNLCDWRERPRELQQKILEQVGRAQGPVAVRVHSSGDFFDESYVTWWREIMAAVPGAAFWAYTRSWNVAALRPALEALRTRPNFQLFASWDTDMPAPPVGWRVSEVVRDEPPFSEGAALGSLLCPEQTGRRANCASCGYCMKGHQGNITFFLH